MVALDALTKIIVAYLKSGGDKGETSNKDVSQISGVSEANVGLNNKFFVSIGLIEGKRGAFKLTDGGAEYAKALDWGRLNEAQTILRKIIKEKPLVVKTLNYIDLNKPVTKDDLVGKIAQFANVPNEPRFSTGIRAFTEMVVLSGLLVEDKDGKIIIGEKEKHAEVSVAIPTTPSISSDIKKQPEPTLPFNISINVDSNTDVEKLKEIIKVLKELFVSKP